MALGDITNHAKEAEVKTGNEKARKRQLEPDEDELREEDEDQVYFDTETRAPARRGRKECRRISGVYREIRSLRNIGGNVEVMGLVFQYMKLPDVLRVACTSQMWNTLASRRFRMHLGNNASFVRLWHSDKPSQYFWMNWQYHYDRELREGADQDNDDEMDGKRNKKSTIPEIQAILTLGNRSAFDQITSDNPDNVMPFLPQEFIFGICQEAIITTPDLSSTDIIMEKFGLDMTVQSLFIPKSKYFTLKAFSLNYTKDSWNAQELMGKFEIPEGDTGSEQSLSAVLFMKYNDGEAMQSFIDQLNGNLKSIPYLGGCVEELGTNRSVNFMDPDSNKMIEDFSMAVGFSIYAGPGATVSVYSIDFQLETADEIILEMKRQADSAPHGFCFIVVHDDRPCIPVAEVNPDPFWEWDCVTRPEPIVQGVLKKMRTNMPTIPIVGIDSCLPVDVRSTSEKNSNVTSESSKNLYFGFLLLTYA